MPADTPTSRRYQLVLACGVPADVAAASGDTVFDITPEQASPVALTDVLSKVEITPADMRAKVLVTVDGDPARALASFAAAVGFAARWVDVATPEGLGHIEKLADHVAERTATLARPETRPDRVVVAVGDPGTLKLAAAADADPDAEPAADVAAADVRLVTVPIGDLAVDDEQATLIRFARYVDVVVPDDDQFGVADAVALTTLVSGLRRRGHQDRFPRLVVARDGLLHVTVDLDAVRSAAGELRRSLRPYQSAIVDPVAPTDRAARLERAAECRSVDEVLRALGSYSALQASERAGEAVDDEQRDKLASVWRCTRPERHTNGDRNPSMKVDGHTVRCYRDDAEQIDLVRLVADTLRVTSDEAADLLLGQAANWAGRALAARHQLFKD